MAGRSTVASVENRPRESSCMRTAVSHDADDHARNLTGWNQMYDQLAPGKFCGSLSEIWLDDIQVFLEKTSHRVRQSCEVWPNSKWIGIPLSNRKQSLIGPHTITSDMIASRPGGVEFELWTPDEFEILGMVIPKIVLDAFGFGGGECDTHKSWPSREVVVIGVLQRERLSMLILQYLAESRKNDAILRHVSSREAMRCSLLEALLSVLGRDDQLTRRGPVNFSRYRLVRQVREYVLDHPDRAIFVPELCRQFHTSRRNLQYCFEDIVDISPASYLKMVRLNGVRRALGETSSGHNTVQDAAAAWGFWHLGQFGHDYKKLFGELPSDSLKNRRR